MFSVGLGVFVKWRTVRPAAPLTHKMAFIRQLSSARRLSVKPADRRPHRPGGERPACFHGPSAPPSPGPTHKHASSGGAAASATRTRRERDGARAAMSGSRARRHPRGNGGRSGGNGRARSRGSGLLPSQRPGVSAFLWVCQRTGSRFPLCPVVVVVDEDEHRAEGRALRQHAHTAGARRQAAGQRASARETDHYLSRMRTASGPQQEGPGRETEETTCQRRSGREFTHARVSAASPADKDGI